MTSPASAPTSTVTAPSGGTTALGGTSVAVAAVLSGAFLAALVTAVIAIWLARRKTREEERNRLRAAFAEAFAAYQAYKEFPYAIRRRRVDAPGEERVRLSEALRSVQADLAYHQAWTVIESEQVGSAFTELVKQVRATAGTAMHEAWNAPANDTDSAMNIPPSLVDLGELTTHETVYIDAVRAHLRRLAPWWAR
ncbi:hypothetical protein [Amycolatopsis pittospori]|uniref:hypothetical protein n=1 Tax=Amycolatopsis pittospori TaxID=2749434 RepID=UPI0015F0431B|nr:hypothetical protein [Amycolatopsis pittospori]